MKPILLHVLCLLILVSLTACGSERSLAQDDKKVIIEQAKVLEQSYYNLLTFQEDYHEFTSHIIGILDASAMQALMDSIIFGYNDKTFTGSDMAKMTRDEWEKHKTYMLGVIRGIGVDQQHVTIRFSDVYPSDDKDQVFLYSSELKKVKTEPYTKTNKKFTLVQTDGHWKIARIEQDRITYGSEQTAAEIQELDSKLKYQTHGDSVVEYLDHPLELQGYAEQ